MVRRVLGLALAHHVVAVALSFATHGLDLDQLRDRSPLSRAAGVPHDVLWAPHDLLLRSIPNPWLVAHPGLVASSAMIVASLAWGTALYGGWVALRHLSRDPLDP